MKRFTVISSLFFSTLLGFSSVHASTDVSTNLTQDTQWDSSGNPYLIKGKVVVSKGSTLHIGPNVQVIFQGASALEVNGTLEVMGSAPAPAVFNMTEGGLQSELYINGGEASIVNAKILSGVFLVRDSKLTLDGSEVTKGSGVYLQGSTTARLKNDKIYGNATGVVLDGTVKAILTFDTIVQNTYGLYLKGFSNLEFKNNSIHDNQKEVVNNTPSLNLGGNYWGTEDVNAVQAKLQGKVDVSPVKSLKDILRVYVRTMLPPITKEMSLALVAKEKREAKQEALALKKFKQQPTSATANAPVISAPPPTEQAAAPVETVPAPPEVQAEVTASSTAPAPPEVQAETSSVSEVET
ncbi:MAG TPA: right-handed parallel beta-helix repeat-containing protein, partial [bacterium]